MSKAEGKKFILGDLSESQVKYFESVGATNYEILDKLVGKRCVFNKKVRAIKGVVHIGWYCVEWEDGTYTPIKYLLNPKYILFMAEDADDDFKKLFPNNICNTIGDAFNLKDVPLKKYGKKAKGEVQESCVDTIMSNRSEKVYENMSDFRQSKYGLRFAILSYSRAKYTVMLESGDITILEKKAVLADRIRPGFCFGRRGYGSSCLCLYKDHKIQSIYWDYRKKLYIMRTTDGLILEIDSFGNEWKRTKATEEVK